MDDPIKTALYDLMATMNEENIGNRRVISIPNMPKFWTAWDAAETALRAADRHG